MSLKYLTQIVAFITTNKILSVSGITLTNNKYRRKNSQSLTVHSCFQTHLTLFISWVCRSAHPFFVNRKTLNIHRKTPVLEPPFDRLAGFKTCDFLKKGLQHRCFPVNIAKFLRALIFMKICEQLLLPFLVLTFNISSQGLVS